MIGGIQAWTADPHYGWFHHDCGTVTENERLPDGRVIARTIERC
jgi:hypothetical protein